MATDGWMTLVGCRGDSCTSWSQLPPDKWQAPLRADNSVQADVVGIRADMCELSALEWAACQWGPGRWHWGSFPWVVHALSPHQMWVMGWVMLALLETSVFLQDAQLWTEGQAA